MDSPMSISSTASSPVRGQTRSSNPIPILGDFLFLHSTSGGILPLDFPRATDVIPIVTSGPNSVSTDIYRAKAPSHMNLTVHNPILVRFDRGASSTLRLNDVPKAVEGLRKRIDAAFKRTSKASMNVNTRPGLRPCIIIHDVDNDGVSTDGPRAVSAVILAYLITIHHRTLRVSLGRLFSGAASATSTCVDVDPATLAWLKECEREMLDRPTGAGASVSEAALSENASTRMLVYVHKPSQVYDAALVALAPSRNFAFSGTSIRELRSGVIKGYVILGSSKEVINGNWHQDPSWIPLPLTGAIGVGYVPGVRARFRDVEYSNEPVPFSSDPIDDLSCGPTCARVDLKNAVYGTFNRLSNLYHSTSSISAGRRKLIMVYDGTPDGHRACAMVVGWLMLHMIGMRDALKIVDEAYRNGGGSGMPMLSRDLLEQLQSLELSVFKKRTRLSYPYFELPADLGLRRTLLAS